MLKNFVFFSQVGSTYLMVERVLELKAFVNESVEIYEQKTRS
jgi:hypothetical protein